jgi:DNA adenine methylase
MRKLVEKIVQVGKFLKGEVESVVNGIEANVMDSIENVKELVKSLGLINATHYYNKHSGQKKTLVQVLFEYVGNKRLFWKWVQVILMYRIDLEVIKTIVIAFAGSGSDFLNIAPFFIEYMKKTGKKFTVVFNDLNPSITNLLNKLINPTTRKLLIKEVEKIIEDQNELVGENGTHEDRKEYHKLLVQELNTLERKGYMNVRRAALFLICMNTTFGGNYKIKNGISKVSISSDIKKFEKYDKAIEKINMFSFFLDHFNVIVENKDYKKVIKKYDGKNTLFLIDPPYLKQDSNILESTKVDYGAKDFPHEECINMVKGLSGQFIYHNYRNNVQTRMFAENKEIGMMEIHKAINNSKSVSNKPKARCVEVMYFSTWNNKTAVEETTFEVSIVETQPSVQVETIVDPTVQTVPSAPVFPMVSVIPMVSMTLSGVINNNTLYRHSKVVIPFLKSVS